MASAKKNKEINHNNLVAIKPITDNQKVVFDTYKKNKNQFLFNFLHEAEVRDEAYSPFEYYSLTSCDHLPIAYQRRLSVVDRAESLPYLES